MSGRSLLNKLQFIACRVSECCKGSTPCLVLRRAREGNVFREQLGVLRIDVRDRE